MGKMTQAYEFWNIPDFKLWIKEIIIDYTPKSLVIL